MLLNNTLNTLWNYSANYCA